MKQIVKTFVYAHGDDANKYEIVLEKLDNYFVPKVNVNHDGARFHKRAQKHRESVEEYIHSLRKLAKKCDFGVLKNENIRDRLVIGILDKPGSWNRSKDRFHSREEPHRCVR